MESVGCGGIEEREKREKEREFSRLRTDIEYNENLINGLYSSSDKNYTCS